MPTIQEQVTWCSDVAKLLQQHKNVQTLKIPEVADEVKQLLEEVNTTARKNAPSARVVKEYGNYAKRFEELSTQAHDIQTKAASKQIKDKVAATQLVQIGQHLVRLAELIKLGLSEFDPARAKDPAIKKLRQAAEKHRPAYEDKRNRITSAIEELKALGPGADNEIQALEKLREAGRFMEPDYAKAYDCLDGLSGLLKAGKKAIAKFDSKIDDRDYKEDITKAEQAIAAFEQVFVLGHGLKIQEWQQQLKNARAIAGTQLSTALSQIQQVTQKATDTLHTLTRQRTDGENDLKARSGELERLEKMAPIETVAPFLQRLEEARSALGTQQFDHADELLKKLDIDINKQLVALQPGHDEWTTLVTNGKLDESVTALKTFIGKADPSIAPTAIAQAKRLLSLVETQAKPLAGQRRFGDALTLLQPEVADLKAFALWCTSFVQDAKDKKPLKDYDSASVKDPVARFLLDLLPYRQQHAQWDAKINKRRSFLQDLGVDVAALPSPVPDRLKAYADQRTPWLYRLEQDEPRAAKRQNAETAEKHAERLKAAPKTVGTAFEKEFVAAADALLTELELDTHLPPKDVLDQRELEQALEKDRRQWALARTQLLDRLQSIDDAAGANSPLLTESAQLRTRVENLLKQVLGMTAEEYQKKSKDERDKLVLKINEEIAGSLKTDIDKLRDKAAAALKNKRSGKPALVKKAEQLLKQLDGELKPGRAKKGQPRESWQAFGETLRMELAAAITMVDTDNMAVLETGLTSLQELTQKVTDLLKLTAGKSAVKAGFEEVQTLKKTLEDKLTTNLDPDAKQYQADAIARLLGEFRTSLSESIKGVSPQEAKKALEDFEIRLQEVINTAAKEKTRHQDVWNVLGTKVETQLNDLAKKPGLEALVKKLQVRLDGAKVGASTADAATLTLRELELTLKLALDDTRSEVREQLNMQASQESLRNESDTEFAPQRYEAAREVFEKNIRRRAASLYNSLPRQQRNTSLYQRIAELASAADKTAKQAAKAATPADKGKLYDSARNSLDLATEAAEAFLENPLSATAASRKALTESQSRWKIAVGGFVSELQQLSGDMERAINADTSTKKTAWQDSALPSVKKLVGLVDAGAFDTAVTLLGKAPPTTPKELAERRKQKEQALLRLSQFERELSSHPLLGVLAGNPFKPVRSRPLITTLAGLRSALLTS